MTMALAEKQAWYSVSVLVLALLVFGILVWAGFGERAMGASGIIGLVGLTVFFGWKQRRRGMVTRDERDREIERRALLAGLRAVYIALIAASVAPAMLKGSEWIISVSANELAFVSFAALALALTVQSLATITLYRRGRIMGADL